MADSKQHHDMAVRLAQRPSLTEADARIALAVIRLLARGAPASAERVAELEDVSRAEVQDRLDTWEYVYTDTGGQVIGFLGLAIDPTPHRMEIGERTLYGWCALDVLFLPELIGEKARVQSRCPMTGTPVELTVDEGGVSGLSPSTAVVSMLHPDEPGVDHDRVISTYCHHIYFLASPEDWREWVARERNGTLMLAMDEAWELARTVNELRFGDLLSGSPRG